MDKKVVKEIVQAQNEPGQEEENEDKDMFMSKEEMEDKIKQCIEDGKVERFFREEDSEFFNSCLRKLGLCERKGLDGQIMLYPVKSKERKLEKEEFHELVDRLYTVKRIDKADYVNLNEKTI